MASNLLAMASNLLVVLHWGWRTGEMRQQDAQVMNGDGGGKMGHEGLSRKTGPPQGLCG